MTMNKLKIIETANLSTQPSRRNQREETRAKFEQLWLSQPELFDPNQDVMQRERIERTWNLLLTKPLNGKQAADLGCGKGILAKRLAEQGAKVVAVDIAPTALKQLNDKDLPNLLPREDYVPNTLLADEEFDIVISTDLIAYLPADQFRLYFSELARIIRPNGFVVCSTAIDIDSEDALQRFLSLSETEFKIEKSIFSYHALYIRLCNMIDAPKRFVHARFPFSVFWKALEFIVRPLSKLLKNSRWMLLTLEKICRFISSDAGISHVIWIGSRRALVEHMPPEKEIPKERKQRRFVWE